MTMMKSLTAAAASLVLVLLTGCQSSTPPEPEPAPSPTPIGAGDGFDCDHPPAFSGMVAVKEPIADRYIVVLKTPAPTAGAAGSSPAAGGVAGAMSKAEVANLAQTLAAAYGGRNVRVFAAAVSGFACSVDAGGAAKMTEDARACILENASRDKLAGVGAGSPNLLLYARQP
jgi:hypothetical protein